MKCFFQAILFCSSLVFWNQNVSAKDSARGPVSITIQAIEPLAWLPGVCTQKFSAEPKYVLQVKTLDGSHEPMNFRIYSDLCSYNTAQFIGSLYITEDGQVIGISAVDDIYAEFSHMVVGHASKLFKP